MVGDYPLAEKVFRQPVQYSPIRDSESMIGLSNNNSFVLYQGKWIDLESMVPMSAEPLELKMLFNTNYFEKR